nr:PD-(D/E)XK motif protein [Nitrospirota bacterium]
MSGIAPEVWTRLAGERTHGEILSARRAAQEVTERLVAAVDAEGQRHLLVLLQEGEEDIHDTLSRGLGVNTRELAVPGHEAGRYLDITCYDIAGHEAFDLIGGELAERLAAGRETAPETVSRVLAKWRRFWGQLPQHLLSRDQQLGLFAELWFLSVWLVPRVGTAEAVTRWRGPFGARHDFEWEGLSVEVKATTSTRGLIHRINGLDQLMPPDRGKLLLFSLRLREEAGASNSLPALVAVCREQLEGSDEALSRFESSLLRAGYSFAHEDEYGNVRLRIVQEGLFAVRDNFPQVTPPKFTDGVPAGVEHVEYEINLDGFLDLLVARSAGEATGL